MFRETIHPPKKEITRGFSPGHWPNRDTPWLSLSPLPSYMNVIIHLGICLSGLSCRGIFSCETAFFDVQVAPENGAGPKFWKCHVIFQASIFSTSFGLSFSFLEGPLKQTRVGSDSLFNRSIWDSVLNLHLFYSILLN